MPIGDEGGATTPVSLATPSAPTSQPIKSGASSTPFPQGVDIKSRWSRDLLTRLGLPVTAENIRFLNAWQDAEGTRARFNPLATSRKAAGATQFNSHGVKNYTSYEQGLQATVETLRINGYGYPAILASLKLGNDAEATARAVASSEWGTGQGVLRVLSTGGGQAGDSAAFGSGSTFAQAQAAEDRAWLNPTDAELINYARKNYGYLAFYLDNPEIRRVLLIAARNGWGNAEIQGELVKTTWWKQTSETARNWDILNRSDPAEAKRQTDQRHGELRTAAQRAGIQLTDSRLREIAKQSLRNGWSSEQMQAALAAEFDFDPQAAPTGQAAASLTEMRALAAQYAIQLSDGALQQWTRDMLAGTASMDGFRAYLIDMAKDNYAGNELISRRLDEGRTVLQLVDPYRQQIGTLLGLDPDMIDWNEAKWRRLLHTYDAQAKAVRPMTPDEVRRELKTNRAYGYLDSTAGKAEAAEFASGLARQLGYA